MVDTDVHIDSRVLHEATQLIEVFHGGPCSRNEQSGGYSIRLARYPPIPSPLFPPLKSPNVPHPPPFDIMPHHSSE